MKKFLIMLLAVCALASTAVARDKAITRKDLPTQAQTFLTQYFPKNDVQFAKLDSGFYNEYEVILRDGSEIEFDQQGQWEKVKCMRTPVPDALVPNQIRQYVATNFPNEKIIEIEKKKRGYEIELSNHYDLKFNAQMQLVEIDR